MTTTLQIPPGAVVCTVCNGKCVIPLSNEEILKPWNLMRNRTEIACTNCGGQTMGRAMGYTRIDPATGVGCVHENTYRNLGHCCHEYICKKCGYKYEIDSGD